MRGFSNKEREAAAQAIFVAAEVEKTWRRCGHFTDGTQASLYRKQADACLGVAFAAMYDRIKELENTKDFTFEKRKFLTDPKPVVGFNNTCEFCKFSDEKNRWMRCHRLPPQVVLNPNEPVGSRIHGYFPKVSKDGWCGEWQYRGSGE